MLQQVFLHPAFVTVCLGLMALATVMGSPRVRVLMLIVGIHTLGLGSIDVGVSLEPPKVVAFAAWLHVLSGGAELRRSQRSLLFSRFWPFVLWTIVITAVGYLVVPADHGASWARSSAGKPFVQCFSLALLLPFCIVAAGSLKSRQDVEWICRKWMTVATISALLCLTQVGFHLATGNFLWGVLREGGEFPMGSFLGLQFQRANAFGGEPKQQGIAMVIDLVALLCLRRTGYLRASRLWFTWRAVAMFLAAFFTFSTSAYLMLAGWIVLSPLLAAKKQEALHRFAVIMLVGAVIAVFNPDAMVQLYEDRFQRLFDLAENSRVVASGNFDENQTSDKEIPAAAYLLAHPLQAIVGTGVGTAPFYYEHMVSARFRGIYGEPNSGVLWATYSFGMIGSALFLIGARPLITARNCVGPSKLLCRNLWLVVLLSFLPNHLVSWMLFTIGFSLAVGAVSVAANKVQRRSVAEDKAGLDARQPGLQSV